MLVPSFTSVLYHIIFKSLNFDIEQSPHHQLYLLHKPLNVRLLISKNHIISCLAYCPCTCKSQIHQLLRAIYQSYKLFYHLTVQTQFPANAVAPSKLLRIQNIKKIDVHYFQHPHSYKHTSSLLTEWTPLCQIVFCW